MPDFGEVQNTDPSPKKKKGKKKKVKKEKKDKKDKKKVHRQITEMLEKTAGLLC